MSDEPAVLTERRDGVLLVTLNRPEQRNAVNLAVAEGVAAAMDQLDADPGLTVGVLTGRGRGFCAGMDLKAFVRGERPHAAQRGFAGIAEKPPAKPIIAAVEGFALAGGLEVALACDLIVAGRGARFGIPEVRRGLAAAAGGLLRLPVRLPYHLAMEMALTGEPFTAERMHEFGVVNRLADDGGALDDALELAAQITRNAPLALRASKRIIQESRDWSTEEMWRRQGEITGAVFASEDAQEGARAFAEKRAPEWQGR